MHSVIIATHNRANRLRDTLHGLRRLATSDAWELIVVDNNSTDGTSHIVRAEIPHFPVRLTYVFEPEPGRSAALNSGFRVEVRFTRCVGRAPGENP